MKQKFTDEQKQELLMRYHNGESATNLCLEKQIGRSTFYNQVKKFEKIESKKYKNITLVNLKSLEREMKRKDEIIAILRTVDCTYNSSLKEKLYELEKLYDKYNSEKFLMKAIKFMEQIKYMQF